MGFTQILYYYFIVIWVLEDYDISDPPVLPQRGGTLLLSRNFANYWIFFEPFVKVFRSIESALVYNTLNGDKLVIDDGNHLKYIDELLLNRKLPIRKSCKEVKEGSFISFFDELRKKYLIGALPVDENPCPMVIAPPIKRESFDGGFVTDDLLNHLKRLNIVCFSKEQDISPIFKGARRQFPFFEYLENGREEINIFLIEKIFEELKGRTVAEVHLFTTDFGQHRDFPLIAEMAEDFQGKSVFNITASNLTTQLKKLRNIRFYNNISLSIHFLGSVADSDLAGAVDFLIDRPIGYEFVFVVRNEMELDYYSDLIEKFSPKNYRLQPFYDGSNLGFFKENVCSDSSPVEKICTNEEILTNSIFNTENYGNLSIDLKGRVYGSFNKKPLGNIETMCLPEIVYKELKNGDSWCDVRKKREPCCNCIYNCICSPVNGYEYVIGSDKLCFFGN